MLTRTGTIIVLIAALAACKKEGDKERPKGEPPAGSAAPTAPSTVEKPKDPEPPPPPVEPTDPTASWAERKGAGFTVKAPEDPDVTDKDLPTAVGILPSKIYTGYVPDGSPGAMQVMVTELPAKLDAKPKDIAAKMKESVSKLFGGTTITEDKDVTVGDAIGKDFRFTGEHPQMGKFGGRSRVLVSGKQLIQVQVMHAADAADFAKQGDVFVESFVFAKP
jgi:hypothetical protein